MRNWSWPSFRSLDKCVSVNKPLVRDIPIMKDMTSTLPNKSGFLSTYVSYMGTQVLRDIVDVVTPGGTVSNFQNVICKDGVNSYFRVEWDGILPRAVLIDVKQRAYTEGWMVYTEHDFENNKTIFNVELTTDVHG